VRPTKAILLPRSTNNEMSLKSFYLRSFLTWSADNNFSWTFEGNRNIHHRIVIFIHLNTIYFINFLIIDCAMEALDALARNFSINFSVSSIFGLIFCG
jgi:hypothetical protein